MRMTTPVPIASASGRFRCGLRTSPAVNVTLFHASDENSDPTCATAMMVTMPTSAIGPPTPTCTGWRAEKPALCQKFAPKFAAMACALRPMNAPNRTSPSNAAVFAKVNTFCTAAPSRTPKTFSTERKITTSTAIRFCVFSPTSMLPSTIGPTGIGGTCHRCTIQFVADIDGKNTPRNLPNATPTAAIVPVWITRYSVQPYRKPHSGPSDSRRYTYCPPACGIIAASSP